MIAHTIFAIVLDGVIKNVTVGDYEMTNYIAKAAFGETALAVEVTQYPVQEGDLYKNAKFYRVNAQTKVETEILPLPTEKDEIARLTAELAAANETLAVYDAAIADLGAAVSAQNATGGNV